MKRSINSLSKIPAKEQVTIKTKIKKFKFYEQSQFNKIYKDKFIPLSPQFQTEIIECYAIQETSNTLLGMVQCTNIYNNIEKTKSQKNPLII